MPLVRLVDIDKNKRLGSNLDCRVEFVSGASNSDDYSIDFSRWVDTTPMLIHPRLPTEVTTEIFKKMGMRFVLVALHGKLLGIITRKDIIRLN